MESNNQIPNVFQLLVVICIFIYLFIFVLLQQIVFERVWWLKIKQRIQMIAKAKCDDIKQFA